MHFREALKIVEESREYQDFIKKNPNFYLVHGFRLDEGKPPYPWQIGYYSKSEDKIVVFDCTAVGNVKTGQKEDAFKKDKTAIEPISLDDLEVFLDKALEIVSEAKNKTSPNDSVMKRLVLLQKINGRQVWNVTLVTHAFKLFNVQVDTTSGEIVHQSYESIMSMGK